MVSLHIVHTHFSLSFSMDWEYQSANGQYWTISIELESITPTRRGSSKRSLYPVCVEGEYASPHEDQGMDGFHSIWSTFRRMRAGGVQSLSDAERFQLQVYYDRFGTEWSPEYFDVDAVNVELKRIGVR